MEELTQAAENAEQEKAQRYVLWAAVNDLDDIRELSEDTIRYAADMYESMKKLEPEKIWELVPRVVSDVIAELFKKVDANKAKGKTITTKLGDFMTIGIEYAGTNNADKEGTFNPVIEVGPELQYDNEDKKKNELPTEVPMFDPKEQDTMDFVCKSVQNKLRSKYGVVVEDYKAVEYIFTSFLRKLKQYLIANKDKADYGCDITLGETLNIGLTKYDADGTTKYCIGIDPGRIIKMEYAKSDEKSEADS